MDDELLALLKDAKKLGASYYRLTGKPLGVTGEVAEYEAARLLSLELLKPREPGADARGADGVPGEGSRSTAWRNPGSAEPIEP